MLSSSGFSANIKMEPAECGITFIRLNSTFPEHTFSWPMSSSNYGPNTKCDWTIEVPDTEQVDIHFEKFDLQAADSGGKCSFDYLQVTDADVSVVLRYLLLYSSQYKTQMTFRQLS